MHRGSRYVAGLCAAATAIALSGYGVRADVPQVPTGTWASAGLFGDIPADAASAVLPDGRLVVSGGLDGNGQPLALTAIYDPAFQTWVHAGDMSEARAGHTATALTDGRVLITGGRTAAGLAISAELYDPQTGISAPAGSLSLPRTNHAAARLADGRVLIVGGSDGQVPLSLAEIFDPATGQSAGVSFAMSTARVRATATTLLDGHVLVVGGSDGTNDLSSAEIFEPATGSFFMTGAMQTARSGHVAVLLPNNNQVLIAGGTSAGTAVSSAELYADWRNGFSAAPNPMSAARAGGIGAGLQGHDLALVGGGGPNTAEYFGYTTVKTDKDDYAPYETVTISGSGWQPGEKVRLRVSEDADTHYDWELEAIADEFGNIINRDFYPRNDEVYRHVGMRFYVSAVGIASQALATFTDASQTNTSLNSSPNPSAPGENVTFTATIRGGNTQGSGPLVTVGSVDFYNESGGQNCSNRNGVLLGNAAVDANGKASLVVAFQSGGTYTIQACYRGTGGGNGTQDSDSPQITQTVNSAANTTTTASNASATFSASNQDVTLNATVTSTNTVNAGSVTFTVKNGAVTIGSAVVAPVISGNASATFVLPANTPAGTYSIQAAYSGDTGFNSSSDTTKTLTVGQGSQAAVTVSAPASATYQQTGLSAVASGGSGTGAYSYSHGASTACTVNSTTGALTITSGTGTCSITATRAGDANYNPSSPSAPASVTISSAPITVTADAKSKEYGAADPELTYKVTAGSLVSGDSFTGSLTRVAGENVGSYAIKQGTLSAGSNYALTFVGANLTINARPVTVTADAKSKTYGDADPALTYTAVRSTARTASRAAWRVWPARTSAATRSSRAR